MRIINLNFLSLLLFLGLSFPRLQHHAVDAEGLFEFDVKRTVQEKALTFRPNHPVKLLSQDLYNALVREGVVPMLRQFMERMGNELSSSVHHRIAQGWHRLLCRHLRVAEFPESWIEASANVHQRFGGKGDFRNAFPEPGKKRGSFNLKSGKLKSEFMDLATFALWANVPEGIEECGPEESLTSIACVENFLPQLRLALRATLLTFYRFIVPRYPSSRIAAASFVVAVVSPCPFGYLAEPRVVLAALREDEEYMLSLMTSPKKALKAEPCKDMKMALLKLLLKEGVTPGDYIRKRRLEEELGKIEDSISKRIDNEIAEVNKAAYVVRRTLLRPPKIKQEGEGKDEKGDKKEGDKDDEEELLYTAGGLYDALEEYLINGPINHLEYFFRSIVGRDAKSIFNSHTPRKGPFYDKLRFFLEGQPKNPLEGLGKGLQFLEQRAEFKKDLEEETKENPQKIPLRRGKQPAEKEANEALYIAKHFKGNKNRFEVPKDDEEEEKKK